MKINKIPILGTILVMTLIAIFVYSDWKPLPNDLLEKPIKAEEVIIEPEVIEEVLGEVVIKKPIQIQPMTAPMLKVMEKQGVKNLNATEFNQLKASFKLRKANIISTGVININELTILNQATTRKIKESGKPLQINSSLNGVQYIEFLIESL